MNDDLLRPAFHFTAPASWINDPNGLVFADGEYHLFYQCNPHGSNWGNMSWGHAVSTDLTTWAHLPVALEPYDAQAPDRVTMIFSGSAIADYDDRLGLGRPLGHPPLAAFFTAHERAGDTPLRETQCLATSVDAGRTWQRDSANPILDRDRRDFRDPKVFWHAPTQRFVMVVAAACERSIEFYGSVDLRCWDYLSTYGPGAADDPVWECPDLVELTVDASERAWALIYSSGHQQGPPFSGMRYIVGTFDGTEFSPLAGEPTRSFDHGKDFFAGVTFNGIAPEHDPVMIAWASNWAYASHTPSEPWRGQMSLPRRLSLVRRADGLRIAQRPIAPATHRPIDISIEPHGASAVAAIRLGSADEYVEIGYDRDAGELFIDRRNSCATTFSAHFASREFAALQTDEMIRLEIYRDGCVLEIFADDGVIVFTELHFSDRIATANESTIVGTGIHVSGIHVSGIHVSGIDVTS